MAEISHVNYNGDSKVIIRLCSVVNALADGGASSGALEALSAQVIALQTASEATSTQVAALEETLSVLPAQIVTLQEASVTMSAQVAALREALGVLSNGLMIEAEVREDILILTGTGALARKNRLILLSGDAVAADDVLHFGAETPETDIQDDVFLLSGSAAAVEENHIVVNSPDVSVRDGILYFQEGFSWD